MIDGVEGCVYSSNTKEYKLPEINVDDLPSSTVQFQYCSDSGRQIVC